MSTKFQTYDVFNLIDEEQGSETNALVAGLAGVASGLIKVPEGIISLGAELIDLGFDTDTAAKVEKEYLIPLIYLKKLQMIGRLVN